MINRSTTIWFIERLL